MARNTEHLEHTHNSIASGTEIIGDIKIQGNIRFEGTLVGNLIVSSKVVLGNTGQVSGNIECEEADVMGKIEGNVFCTNNLILRSDSNVDGEINTDILTIEAGAQFNGICNMGKKSKKQDL